MIVRSMETLLRAYMGESGERPQPIDWYLGRKGPLIGDRKRWLGKMFSWLRPRPKPNPGKANSGKAKLGKANPGKAKLGNANPGNANPPNARAAQAKSSVVGRRIQPSNPWHAVSIATNKHCCQASIALKHRRFLSGEAPRLPLKDCGQPAACTCVYKHFSDRRAGSRRAAEQGIFVQPSARATSGRAQDRRRAPGRRVTDSE